VSVTVLVTVRAGANGKTKDAFYEVLKRPSSMSSVSTFT
jgi:hypothetical protein